MFSLDAGSPIPPYEQLRAQVVQAVREGRLAAGAKLPTVRALAVTMGLAANTVARAYRELEHDGVIETRGRAGSFVAANGDGAHQAAQLAAVEYAATVKRLGLGPSEALAIAEAALRTDPPVE